MPLPAEKFITAIERIAHYHELAAQFRKWAETEPNEGARAGLLEMARQYDRLASEIELKDAIPRS